jgi:hypothetical protein
VQLLAAGIAFTRSSAMEALPSLNRQSVSALAGLSEVFR